MACIVWPHFSVLSHKPKDNLFLILCRCIAIRVFYVLICVLDINKNNCELGITNLFIRLEMHLYKMFHLRPNSDYIDSHVPVKSYVWLRVSVLAIHFGA